jgi:hypothetical protein
MTAKYTTTPSSTLPQAPALTAMLAYWHSRRSHVSRTNALAFINALFDAVGAVPYTGNNQLTVMWAVLERMARDSSLGMVDAITAAGADLAAVEAVQA